ncbi:MAG TPA: META domain-containing protein [Asticcacaulis sp.]|nr:META domain-containing protein [Asticcacaulis sp.]
MSLRPLLPLLALIPLSACASLPWSGEARVARDLGGDWRLAATPDAAPADPAKYELSFLPKGRAAFRLDCNRANGIWEAKPLPAGGGALTFGPLAMTRAMCGQDSLDTSIARDMADVVSYRIDGDMLILNLRDGGAYRWTRATSP